MREREMRERGERERRERGERREREFPAHAVPGACREVGQLRHGLPVVLVGVSHHLLHNRPHAGQVGLQFGLESLQAVLAAPALNLGLGLNSPEVSQSQSERQKKGEIVVIRRVYSLTKIPKLYKMLSLKTN